MTLLITSTPVGKLNRPFLSFSLSLNYFDVTHRPTPVTMICVGRGSSLISSPMRLIAMSYADGYPSDDLHPRRYSWTVPLLPASRSDARRRGHSRSLCGAHRAGR